MITEGDLVAVHSNYNTWNSPTRSHAQSLGQRSIDGHSQAEPHANLERLLAAQANPAAAGREPEYLRHDPLPVALSPYFQPPRGTVPRLVRLLVLVRAR
jgi:hypothetical protein